MPGLWPSSTLSRIYRRREDCSLIKRATVSLERTSAIHKPQRFCSQYSSQNPIFWFCQEAALRQRNLRITVSNIHLELAVIQVLCRLYLTPWGGTTQVLILQMRKQARRSKITGQCHTGSDKTRNPS